MILPAFSELLGAADGPHRVEEATVKIDDPDSPLTRSFAGKSFTRVDEFYHFPMTGPYTREKLHVLLSVDADKSDLQKWLYLRPDRDFGMVWIKREGKGRVFNSVLGHRPDFYMMPDLVKLMLGGIQFVLGDLEAAGEARAVAVVAVDVLARLRHAVVIDADRAVAVDVGAAPRCRVRAGRGRHGEAVLALLVPRRASPHGRWGEDVEVARQRLHGEGRAGAGLSPFGVALSAALGALPQAAQVLVDEPRPV